jgi:hypothetical protein
MSSTRHSRNPCCPDGPLERALPHPFAYLAVRVLRFGHAMRASLDLQPQN